MLSSMRLPRIRRVADRVHRRAHAWVGAALATALVVAWPGPAVAAQRQLAAACTSQPAAGEAITATPWPQLRYDLGALAALTEGAGVTVAVLDSGVDPTNPQLTGAVRGGGDLLGTGSGLDDCQGHGTAVASIIAARPHPGSALRGLAPAATILSIRVGDRVETEQGFVGTGKVQNLVDGIRLAIAANPRPRVLNLSISTRSDSPALRAAIQDALAADIVVVAAAGNDRRSARPDEFDPPIYPAAYDGVVGVGAIDEAGLRWAQSQVGEYVDLVAPGVDVIGAVPRSGQARVTGTSYATPFVAATAALIRARFPDLRQDEVVRRLLATADPSAGGQPSPDYGYGVVNPLRALTEIVPPEPAPVAVDPTAVVAPRDPGQGDESGPTTGTLIALGVLLAATLGIVALAVTVPLGTRRRWRPGTVGDPADATRPAPVAETLPAPPPPPRVGVRALGPAPRR